MTIHGNVILVHHAVKDKVPIRSLELSLAPYQHAGTVIYRSYIYRPGQRKLCCAAACRCVIILVLHHTGTCNTIHIIVGNLCRIGQAFKGLQRIRNINPGFFQLRSIGLQILIQRIGPADQCLICRRVFRNIIQFIQSLKEIRHMLFRFLPFISGKKVQQLVLGSRLYRLCLRHSLVQAVMTAGGLRLDIEAAAFKCNR